MADGRAEKARKWREQQEKQQKSTPKVPEKALSPGKEMEMTENVEKQPKSNSGKKKAPWLEKHKWAPGQSGNPRGRVPGIDLISVLKKELEREITLETGEKRKAAQHLIRSILYGAIKGNFQQQRLIMNYIQGLPKLSIDLNHTIRQFEEVAPEKLLEIVRVNLDPALSGNGRNGKQLPRL